MKVSFRTAGTDRRPKEATAKVDQRSIPERPLVFTVITALQSTTPKSGATHDIMLAVPGEGEPTESINICGHRYNDPDIQKNLVPSIQHNRTRIEPYAHHISNEEAKTCPKDLDWVFLLSGTWRLLADSARFIFAMQIKDCWAAYSFPCMPFHTGLSVSRKERPRQRRLPGTSRKRQKDRHLSLVAFSPKDGMKICRPTALCKAPREAMP